MNKTRSLSKWKNHVIRLRQNNQFDGWNVKGEKGENGCVMVNCKRKAREYIDCSLSYGDVTYLLEACNASRRTSDRCISAMPLADIARLRPDTLKTNSGVLNIYSKMVCYRIFTVVKIKSINDVFSTYLAGVTLNNNGDRDSITENRFIGTFRFSVSIMPII